MPAANRAQLLMPVNAGPTLACYGRADRWPMGLLAGYDRAVFPFWSTEKTRVFMLVQVKATVEGVGEAEELADIGRSHRIGAVIGALMEALERAHPGVSLLEHRLTIESKPIKGAPDGTAIVR